MVGFNTTDLCLRKVNLFHIPFYRKNYSSDTFFLEALTLANHIMDYVDFLCHIVFLIKMYTFKCSFKFN